MHLANSPKKKSKNRSVDRKFLGKLTLLKGGRVGVGGGGGRECVNRWKP